MKLRFGTFNLFQFCKPPYSYYTRKERFKEEAFIQKCDWIKQQIKKMDCDIIGFQEVFTPETLEEICNELGFKYFEVVDKSKLLNPNTKIYTSTTVAIASKYPIKSLHKVRVHPKALEKHHFKGHFSFSRLPIKARIELPDNKEIMTYVVHLKSNRLNEFEYLFNETHTLKDKIATTQNAILKNMSPALTQRLCEASCLYHDIKKVKIPTVLMGDFNDKAFALTHDALTNRTYHNAKEKGYILKDATTFYKPKIYNPHPEAKPLQRTPTSYYQGKGNVLDYVFISKEFKVTNYEVLDKHLQENSDGSLLQSDHAQVICEVEI